MSIDFTATGSDFGRGLPQSLFPVESARNVWGYVVSDDRDWRDCLRPAFWHAHQVMQRLNPGDRIEVHTADRQVQFELLVLAVNQHADPLRLDLGYRAIWPLDLALPPPTITAPPRYRVRQHSRGTWEIVGEGNRVVAESFTDREAAMRAMAVLEQRDDNASAAMAREAEAEIVPPPRPHDPPQRRLPRAAR